MERTRVDTVLHGGAVVVGETVQVQDIAITGETIVAVGVAEVMPDAERVIDVTGKLVFPGLIDAHAHFTYDDVAQGTLLSAHGGITTTIPFLGGSDGVPEIVARGLAEAKAGAVIDYAFHVILWPSPDSDYLPLVAGVGDGVAQGVRSYKLKEPGWKNIFYTDEGTPIPFGAPSAETIVPLMYAEGVVKRGLPPWWLARVMAENPARMFGLYPRKGVIAVGADADFTVIDPAATTIFTAERMHSRTGYTPYEGWTLPGAPVLTMVRGQVVLEHGTVQQERGFGAYIPARHLLPPVYGPVRPLFA